jgi:hypothetical protein
VISPKSGAGLERNHLPLSAEITCRFRPKSGAGLLRFLHSHVRALSLPELASLFSGCGLGQPWITRYELPVELKDLLARAFPNPGDEAEIAAVFTAAAVDGRLGIPVRREGEAIHIAYQAAIFATSAGH